MGGSTGWGKNVAPYIFCSFLRVGLEFQGETLNTYVAFPAGVRRFRCG